jgi:hypothetical protein
VKGQYGHLNGKALIEAEHQNVDAQNVDARHQERMLTPGTK